MLMAIFILKLIFIGATIVNICYWLILFSKFVYFREQKRSESEGDSGSKIYPQPLVSIIICAKNEAENLRKFLPRILSQTYRSIELVLVEDGSTDNTLEIMQEFQKRNSTLRIIIISNTKKLYIGKKEALLKGVNAASGDLILLTDADCEPIGDQWAATMSNLIQKPYELGLGYSPYRKYPGLLNRLIRLETIYTAIQYFSFAVAGMPYMGVGRNLIYKKELIERVNGFHEHIHLASGDDDLFVNAVATSSNTAIQLSPESFMISEPARTWKAYYRQKSRHLTTGQMYKKKHQLLLGALAMSHLLHYMGGFVLVYIKVSTIFVFLLYVMRMLVVMYLYNRILRKLRDPSLLPWVPIFDFAFVLYYCILSPSLLKRKTQQWK